MTESLHILAYVCSSDTHLKKTTSLPKVIWEEGRVAALSDTGRFDNEGESGRRKTDSLLRRTSLGPPHAPPQTAAPAVEALSHTFAVKSPLVTMAVSYTHLTLPTKRIV